MGAVAPTGLRTGRRRGEWKRYDADEKGRGAVIGTPDPGRVAREP